MLETYLLNVQPFGLRQEEQEVDGLGKAEAGEEVEHAGLHRAHHAEEGLADEEGEEHVVGRCLQEKTLFSLQCIASKFDSDA